jgi:uncharacterized protein (TIGR03435 family)
MVLGGLLFAGLPFAHAAIAQTAFAVATIRPSAAAVQFEHDGRTEISPGSLNMRDVTLNTCIKWAYGVQDSQILGPGTLKSDHYDIVAKADGQVGEEQMKLMIRTLLGERFKLSFHRDKKELRAYALTVVKSGPKLHPAEGDGRSIIQNSAIGTTAKSTTMAEFANFLAQPLQTPVVDATGLPGKYDFSLDFSSYLPEDKSARPDVGSILLPALQRELGLKLEPQKLLVEVFVVDQVEKPSAN